MSGSIELFGFDEFKEQIEKLQFSNNDIERAIDAGCEIIKSRVKPKIPKSNLSKDHAADHIVISKLKKKNGVLYKVVGPEKGDNGTYFYLKFYEFGTSNPNALGKVIAPRAMFGSTVAEEKGNVKAAMVEKLKEGLNL